MKEVQKLIKGEQVHYIVYGQDVRLSNVSELTLDKELIALEKTSSDHYNNTSNPHNVTKTQLGLGNAENTADSVKNVLSATKLYTPRLINGTTFNGTSNITTDTWGAIRQFKIGNSTKPINGGSNISYNLAEIGAVNKAGDTITGNMIMRKGYNVSSSDGQSGVSGYVLSARITITGSYITCPIEFKIINRNAKSSMHIFIRFMNASTNDPDISTFIFYGDERLAYLYKSATGVWDLYIHKSEPYDTIAITDVDTHFGFMGNVNITYPGTLVSNVPTGSIQCVRSFQSSTSDGLTDTGKAQIKSYIQSVINESDALLINKLYPVNSVKMTFTDINPGNTIPNTVWTLISQGRYLRGVDPSDGNLNTAKIGGSNTINTAHTHYINAHSHTLNHTHTIPDHAHTIDHAHSINGHSHTVNNHTHSTGGHTLSIAEMPSHTHDIGINDGQMGFVGGGAAHPNTHDAGITCDGHSYRGGKTIWNNKTGGGGSHSHGDTGGSAPGTNDVGLTTNTGGGWSSTTGLWANDCGGYTGGVDMNTNAGGGAIDVQPVYQTVYVWRRIA